MVNNTVSDVIWAWTVPSGFKAWSRNPRHKKPSKRYVCAEREEALMACVSGLYGVLSKAVSRGEWNSEINKSAILVLFEHADIVAEAQAQAQTKGEKDGR